MNTLAFKEWLSIMECFLIFVCGPGWFFSSGFFYNLIHAWPCMHAIIFIRAWALSQASNILATEMQSSIIFFLSLHFSSAFVCDHILLDSIIYYVKIAKIGNSIAVIRCNQPNRRHIRNPYAYKNSGKKRRAITLWPDAKKNEYIFKNIDEYWNESNEANGNESAIVFKITTKIRCFMQFINLWMKSIEENEIVSQI